MASYASERLSGVFEKLSLRDKNASLEAVFRDVLSGGTGHSNQLAVLYLFADLRVELSLSRMGARPQKRAFEKVNAIGSNFMAALNSANWDGFRQKLDPKKAQNDLDDITDLLETAGLPRSAQIDRSNVTKETSILLKELERLKLPEEISRVARAKLIAVQRLLDQKDYATDAVISQNIKSVVADLLVELEPYLDNEPKVRDRIISWGRAGTHATVFALGLVADSAAVHELLTADPEPKLIEAPLKQVSDETGNDASN